MELRAESCEFWGLDSSKFSLYDENLHDLMSLNQEPTHPAHTVEKFFEIIRLKSVPTLYLWRPDRENTMIMQNQKDAIRIKSEYFGEGNRRVDYNNQRVRIVNDKQNEKENVKRFLEIYPGMNPYYIGDKKSRKVVKSHL